MSTRTRVAAAITGGAAIVAVLVATPSFAADQDGVTPPRPGNGPNQQNAQQLGDCDGTTAGRGNGQGMNGRGAGRQGRGGMGGGMGAGMGAGIGADLTNVASGTLTAAQKSTLAVLAEEEKLAHDLYVTFADTYGTAVFSRISNAETRHLTEARIVLKRYAITDPTAGKAVGTFSTASTQQLYNKLVAQGTTSVDGAYAAARIVESTDITDLKAARTGVTAPDVLAVYTHLLAGSERHLVAFGG
jgi:hypothetical protein